MAKELVDEKERSTVTVLVDAELRNRLIRRARANERSLGAEVRIALRRSVLRPLDRPLRIS